MIKKIYYLGIMFGLLLGSKAMAQEFAFENGILKCEGAASGDTAEIDGVTYTAVDRARLDALLTVGHDMATVCTTPVTDLSSVFRNNSLFNDDISSWDVSNVTTLESAFREAESFNQDISGWDVSNVTNMFYTFYKAYSFNQDLNSWDVSKVTDMNSMFRYATDFNGDITSWHTPNVTTMKYMFYNAYVFNQDIGGWYVGAVVDFYGMFRSALLFNQDISQWNTSAAADMTYMFYNAEVFSQNLSNWCVSGVVDNGLGKDENPTYRFDRNSGLTAAQLPQWGACPVMPVSNEIIDADKPAEFALEQNYPNPFNPVTNIAFSIPRDANVQLTVYNMLGQPVAELLNGRKAAGHHTVQFNAENLASGFYIYRITAGDFVSTRKLMLIK